MYEPVRSVTHVTGSYNHTQAYYLLVITLLLPLHGEIKIPKRSLPLTLLLYQALLFVNLSHVVRWCILSQRNNWMII